MSDKDVQRCEWHVGRLEGVAGSPGQKKGWMTCIVASFQKSTQIEAVLVIKWAECRRSRSNLQMFKTRTAVSHGNTKVEIVSLDAGHRMEDI